jgi:hypothetical protein
MKALPMADPRMAEALNDWRAEEPKISQEDLARIAGVTGKTGYRWCKGIGTLKREHVEKLEAHRPGLVKRLFPASEG